MRGRRQARDVAAPGTQCDAILSARRLEFREQQIGVVRPRFGIEVDPHRAERRVFRRDDAGQSPHWCLRKIRLDAGDGLGATRYHPQGCAGICQCLDEVQRAPEHLGLCPLECLERQPASDGVEGPESDHALQGQIVPADL